MCDVVEAIAIARSYWDAEARRDIDAILTHFTEDAILVHPGGRLRGHDEIRTYYASSAAAFPGLEVSISSSLVHGDRGVFEWAAVLIDGDSARHPLNGANLVKFADGRFAEVHTYFDLTGL